MCYRGFVTVCALLLAGAAMAQPAATAMPSPRQSPMHLHIEATGEVEPDMATVIREVEEQGPDAAGVSVVLNRKLDEVVARLRQAGVPAADISSHPRAATAIPTMMMAAGPTPKGAPTPAGGPPEPLLLGRVAPGDLGKAGYTMTADLVVTVHDLARLPQVEAALEQALAPYLNMRRVQYRHADPVAAHRLAVDRAFANAAREAETYAGQLHLRVGRAVLVSNAKAPTNLFDTFKQLGIADPGLGTMRDAKFGVEAAAVAIDYELVP